MKAGSFFVFEKSGIKKRAARPRTAVPLSIIWGFLQRRKEGSTWDGQEARTVYRLNGFTVMG